MNYWFEVVMLTFISGLSIPLGGVISKYLKIKNHFIEIELNHFMVALGGGALLSAVVLVLVPKGSHHLEILPSVLCFGAGGVFFMIIDRYLASNGTSASQLVAMLIDFVPEALALGVMFSISKESGLLLAIIIFIQNLPEGYNAYKELLKVKCYTGNIVLLAFFVMAFLGPISGTLGLFFLTEQVTILSGMMLIGAGGIIYTTFQDIAQQARLRYRWAPSLGAVFGFMLGMIGEMMLQK